tara:strand:+ start:647 stop:844 length:198 start_codon:yes stop_codon:yes gene_type:complete
MASTNLTVTIKVSWWFKYLYLPILCGAFWLIRSFISSDAEPNEDRLNYWVKKSIKVYSQSGKRIK